MGDGYRVLVLRRHPVREGLDAIHTGSLANFTSSRSRAPKLAAPRPSPHDGTTIAPMLIKESPPGNCERFAAGIEAAQGHAVGDRSSGAKQAVAPIRTPTTKNISPNKPPIRGGTRPGTTGGMSQPVVRQLATPASGDSGDAPSNAGRRSPRRRSVRLPVLRITGGPTGIVIDQGHGDQQQGAR